MAKISELPSTASLTGTELVPIVQSSTTKYTLFSTLRSWLFNSPIGLGTTTPSTVAATTLSTTSDATIGGTINASTINSGPIGTWNYLLNGAFDLWQKATSATNPAAYATADRWYFSTSNITVNQVAATVGDMCTWRMRLTATSASNALDMFQVLDSVQVNKLKGKTITFSAYLVTTSTANVNLIIDKSSTANSATTGFSAISTKVCALTNTIARFSTTIAIPDDGTANGLRFRLNFSNITNGNAVDVLKMQVEIGSTPSDFVQRDIGFETSLCTRYRAIYSGAGVYGIGQANNPANPILNFPLIMRTSPTVTYNSLVANDGSVNNAVTAISAVVNVLMGVAVTFTSSGLTTGKATFISGSAANSYLDFNAEII